MVAARTAGGPYGRGNFRTTWQGATVLQAWQAQIQAGLEKVAEDTLEDLRVTIHEDSGEMRRQAFATVEVRGTKRTLVAGSAVPYAAYEELGTIYRTGHPQIRLVVDRKSKMVTKAIADARRGNGA